MFRQALTLCLISLFGTRAHAAADPSLLAGFVGTYFVAEWNANIRASGEVTIQSNTAGIGIVAKGIPKGSFSIDPRTDIASPEETELTETPGDGIRQISKLGTDRLQIDYERGPGFFRVHARRCNARECTNALYVLADKAAPGEEIPAKDFFHALGGNYTIQKAGGAPAKPTVSTFSVVLDEEPDEADIYGPYCLPDGNCDGGYQPFPYAKTRVYARNFGTSDRSYVIITERSGKRLQFRWETLASGFGFANLQYSIHGERVVLEHEFTKP